MSLDHYVDPGDPFWQSANPEPVPVQTPIYVIQRSVKREDNSGRDYWDDEIDPDYGFFTDEGAAQAFVDSINIPAQMKYEERLKAYHEANAREAEKAKQARELGFNHSPQHYWKPDEPAYHEVVTIYPGKDLRK